MKSKDSCSVKKSYDKLDSILKSRDITLLTKVHLVKAMVFPVVMYGCESWTIKKVENWCFWTLESPLDCKIPPVNPKGNQFWIFIRGTDAEAPILWPPDVKNWLIGKDLDSGKDWRQEEKGTTEDEVVGWHHRSWWWTGQPGVLSPWGHKELDTTERLNWISIYIKLIGIAIFVLRREILLLSVLVLLTEWSRGASLGAFVAGPFQICLLDLVVWFPLAPSFFRTTSSLLHF